MALLIEVDGMIREATSPQVQAAQTIYGQKHLQSFVKLWY